MVAHYAHALKVVSLNLTSVITDVIKALLVKLVDTIDSKFVFFKSIGSILIAGIKPKRYN
jgi:hypothetical protein